MSHGIAQPVQLHRKDFVTDQDVRWCPGCGDYSVLAQVQKLLPKYHFYKNLFDWLLKFYRLVIFFQYQ